MEQRRLRLLCRRLALPRRFPLRARQTSADVSHSSLRQTGEQAARAEAFRDLSSGLKVTDLKVFGVSLTPDSDRPYVFVKLETNQGLVGWGEGTLEGKARPRCPALRIFATLLSAKIPCRSSIIWQSMYVHSFYRAGPVIGSAISGIDQALWDLRGKALGCSGLSASGRPLRSSGRAGYYHAENAGRTTVWQNCARPLCRRGFRASRSDFPTRNTNGSRPMPRSIAR